MSSWEREYQEAVAGINSPGTLDDRILQQARQFKPVKVKRKKHLLSGAASSCAAIAVVVLLAHPAQYLGALTPNLQQTTTARQNTLGDPHQRRAPADGANHWYHLRTQVQAGSFVELCNQWRRQQRGSISERLPRDLEDKARSHCRILSQ